jgi:hypothetical protein
MTAAQARQYNRNYQKRLIRYSRPFIEVFQKVIANDYLKAADDPNNFKISVTPYLKAFYRLYITIGLSEAQLRHNELVKQKRDNEQVLYDWGTFLRRHVETITATKVTNIAENTRKEIKDIIQAGLDRGDGYDKIARDLRKAATDEGLKGRINPKARALLIARTEGGSAANLGALTAAKSSGLLMTKQWLHGYNAKRKNRVVHIALGKEAPIPLDQDFVVNGEFMAYPGDPRGGAINVCNCKCSLLTRPVRDAVGVPFDLLIQQPQRESIVGSLIRIAVQTTILTEIFSNLFNQD